MWRPVHSLRLPPTKNGADERQSDGRNYTRIWRATTTKSSYSRHSRASLLGKDVTLSVVGRFALIIPRFVPIVPSRSETHDWKSNQRRAGCHPRGCRHHERHTRRLSEGTRAGAQYLDGR